ncbi:MAG: ribosome recycling factor [Eubacteriaceae bacterium]|nr:ribosome recycling factor [Eubacteriaceae bacterium]
MINEIEEQAQEKMQKSVDSLIYDFSILKAGRANPRMLDKIMVSYYGSATPLNQMAAISSPEPRVLMVAPWDISSLKDIEKAILASDLGINPSNDGKQIRLLVPQLTEERRMDLVKVVTKSGEDCKVALRNIRRSVIDELKKGEKTKDYTEDDVKQGEKDIQKILDDFVKNVDAIMKEKEKEIMTV